MLSFVYDWSHLLQRDYREFPDCVLEEVVVSYGLSKTQIADNSQRDRIISKIKSVPRPHYTTFQEWKSNMGEVSQFLQSSGDLNELLQQHYALADFVLGKSKYKGNVEYNPIHLYWYCVHANVPVNSSSTVSDMKKLLYWNDNTDDELRNRAISSLRYLSRDQLLSLCLLDRTLEKEEYTKDDLVSIHSSLNDVQTLQSVICPSLTLSSVALAAIRYHIDIRWSSNPVIEYQNLRNSNYLPSDPDVRTHYVYNPQYYHIKATFQPEFPECYYTEEILRNHALMFGKISIIEEDDLYRYCCKASKMNHFYVGRTSSNEVNTLTALDVYTDNVLLNYDGNHITCSELTAWWTSEKQFTSPYERKILPKKVITRLRLLLYYDIIPNPNHNLSVDEKNERDTLLNLIDSIIGTMDQLPIIAPSNCKYFKKLMKIGMYMRGWNGKSSYPLSVKDCYNKDTDVKTISRLILSMKNIPKVVNEYTLYIHLHGSYVRDNGDYNTIGKRLALIQDESVDVEDACIRTTSNYFVATAYRVIGGSFPLSSLDYIR